MTNSDHRAEHGQMSWRDVFTAAMAEKDPQKLNDKVAAAEAAIFERLQHLTQNSHSGEERLALREASEALLALKTEVLKFPDWRQD